MNPIFPRKWVCHQPIGPVVRAWSCHGQPSSARGNTLHHLNFSFLAARNANFLSVAYIRFSNIWKSRDLEGNARAMEARDLSFYSDWLLSITYWRGDRSWARGTAPIGGQSSTQSRGQQRASLELGGFPLSPKGLEWLINYSHSTTTSWSEMSFPTPA